MAIDLGNYKEIDLGGMKLNSPIKTPVTTKKKKKEEEDKGYQFGDITKTLGKTALSTVNYLGQGVLKAGEGLLDATLDVATSNINPYYWFNQDELKRHRDIAQDLIKKDATGDLITTLSGDENFNQNFLDKGSLVKSTNIGGQVAQGIGGMLPSIATGGGTAGTTLLGLRSYGGGLEEAYQGGANQTQARLYGLGSAATEIATEWLTGGIPGTKGVGGLDKLVAKGLGQESLEQTSKSLAKEIIKYGYKVAGEGGEEALAEIINPLLKNLTYSKDEKIDWNAVVESAIVGGITGGILDAPSTISSINQVRNNNRLSNQPTTLPSVDLTTQPTINPTQEITNIQDNVVNNAINPLPTKVNYSLDSDNAKINNFRKTANNYLNNTQQTQDFVNVVEKVINDKGYNITLDNSLPSNVSGKIQTKNGETNITLNPNSPKAAEFVLVHEITHNIETKEIKNLILDYASKNAEFDSALKNLQEIYKTNDVSSEVVADISGQLFGNQEFINSLSLEKPSVFKKIYNAIVSLANKITGNSNQALFMRDLKAKWENAYRTSNQTQQGTQYSMEPSNKLYANAEIEQKVKEQVPSSYSRYNIYEEVRNYVDKNLEYINEDLQNNGLDFYRTDDIVIDSKNNEIVTIEYIPKEIENGVYDFDYKIVDYRNSKNFDKNVENTKKTLNEIQKEIENNPYVESVNFENSEVSDSQYLNIKLKGIDNDSITVRLSDHQRPSYESNGGRYDWNYDVEFINDKMNFNKDKVLEAVNEKIQEKAEDYDLDTQYSKDSKTWQEYLNENFKQTGTRTQFKDIKALPTKTSKTSVVEAKNNQTLPVEVKTKTTSEKVKTLPTKKTSKFKQNVETSAIVNQKFKDLPQNYEYNPVTNKQAMEQAKQRLDKDLNAEVIRLMSVEPSNATVLDTVELIELMNSYQEKGLTKEWQGVVDKLTKIGSDSGQIIQVFSIMQRLTPEGMQYYVQKDLKNIFDTIVEGKSKEWIAKNKGSFELTQKELDFIKEAMLKVANTDNVRTKKIELAKIQKMVNDKIPSNLGKEIKSFRRISMLLNPKTQIRNIVGNVGVLPLNVASDTIGAGIDKAISKVTGIRTTGLPSFKEYTKGAIKGITETAQDVRMGIDTSGINAQRFEIGTGKSFNEKTVIGRTLNKLDRINNAALRFGDAPFSSAEFNQSLKNQMKLNKVSEPTAEMIEIAEQVAKERTWQDDNNYTRAVQSIREAMNKVNIKGFGLGDAIIPFAKTPANLTKAAIDYSPVGLMKSLTLETKNFVNEVKKGTATAQQQRKLVSDLSKGITGTLTYLIAYMLRDYISGENDKDKDISNFMQNTLGIQPYSVKIGNKTYTYDWAQPLATPFSVVADLKDSTEETFFDVLKNSLATAGDRIIEQSFLQGINNLLSNFGNSKTEAIADTLIKDLPASFIPTAVKQVNDMIDKYNRLTYSQNTLETSKDKAIAKLPMASQSLPVRYDTLGNEVLKYGGENSLFNVFFNPANISIAKDNKIAEEIIRLYNETGDKTIFPRVAPYGITYGNEKISLTTKQQSKFQKTSGDIVSNELQRIIEDERYKNLTDEEKAKIMNEVVNYAYNKAREEVLNIPMGTTYNKINEYTDNGGLVSDYYLNKEEINYSLENPVKYNTISLITDYDDYVEINKTIQNIKGDNRKQRVFDYINSLKLSALKKSMLFKMYYSSYTAKDDEIYEYLKKQNLTTSEKNEILKQLGFK